jgi:hypothetical protein
MPVPLQLPPRGQGIHVAAPRCPGSPSLTLRLGAYCPVGLANEATTGFVHIHFNVNEEHWNGSGEGLTIHDKCTPE